MSDVVVDSSVVAKWIFAEQDSDRALRLMATAIEGQQRLIVLDLVFPEVANAIWKRYRQRLITLPQAESWLQDLLACPVEIEPAIEFLEPAMRIAIRYERAMYDALFVALAHARGLPGVTADEPLYRAVHSDFPSIALIRDWD